MVSAKLEDPTPLEFFLWFYLSGKNKGKMSSVLPTELLEHFLDYALKLKIDQYKSIFH